MLYSPKGRPGVLPLPEEDDEDEEDEAAERLVWAVMSDDLPMMPIMASCPLVV